MTTQKNRTIHRLFIALIFILLYAPIVLLVIFSFNAGNSNTVWMGFSLDWYEKLFHNRLIMESLYTTLLVSFLATIFATLVGTFASIGFYSMRRRWRTSLLTINNIPMMNADIVTGVSLCLLFVAFFGLWGDFAAWFNGVQSLITLPTTLTMGFGTLLISHITFNTPFVILSVGPRLQQMDNNLVDAAQDLGCTWFQAFWKVILPEIKPGIVSGALMAFTMSIDDFVISYFTAGSSASTLAMTIYGMTKKKVSPQINALSTLLFITVLTLLIIVNLRETRQKQAAERRQKLPTAAEAAKASQKEKPRFLVLLPKLVGGAACIALIGILFSLGMNRSSDREVNVCSWGEYIDESLIDQFEEETGIKVNYQYAESNEVLYSLLKSGGTNYDVIVPSDYMIARLIQEDLLAELNFDNLPNYALIDDQFKNLSYDPENKYSVPYGWGTLGIIYNEKMVNDPITDWDVMFDDTYAGNVLMIRNSRDALGAALLQLGYDLNTTDEAQIREAYQLLLKAKQSGTYQAFVMDEVFQKLEGSNAAVGMFYAGDYLNMLQGNPNLRFVIPESGSNWFVDAMCVLKSSQHKEEAEAWINFISSTESALKNMDRVRFASPNREALEQYPAYYKKTYGEALDPKLYTIMAAPAEVLKRCTLYENLPYDTLELYNDLWTELGI